MACGQFHQRHLFFFTNERGKHPQPVCQRCGARRDGKQWLSTVKLTRLTTGDVLAIGKGAITLTPDDMRALIKELPDYLPVSRPSSGEGR